MVPLLIYHPSLELPAINTDKVTDHTDIFPTIVDYLGLARQDHLLLFGRSVFDDNGGDKGQALLHIEGNYWYVNNEHFIQYNAGSDDVSLFNYGDNNQRNMLGNDLVQSQLLHKVQAYIQYFQNGLLDNNLGEWMKFASPRSQVEGEGMSQL